MHKFGVIVVIVSCCIYCTDNARAQSNLDRKTVLIIKAHTGSLMDAFQYVQNQAAFMFVFQPTLVDQFTELYIPKGTYTVRQFLDTILVNTPIGFEENGRNIIIFRKPTVFDVQGRVTDYETGEPLPMVAVYIKGANKGTTTDPNGRFSIKVEKDQALIISYVGKLARRFVIDTTKTLNVALQSLMLDVVTVNTGYYTIPQAQSVGNIASISTMQIKRTPASNPLQAMQGRMPGVFVEQLSGIPGSGYTVRIRGRNHLREEGNNPLYIIDGVPYPSVSLSSPEVGGDIAPRSNPLNSLDPATIERIDVLKDADATAIYGSRGANGVVLVTTKRATRMGPGAQARIYSGIGQVVHRMNLLNSRQWITMRKEAFKNDDVVMSATNARDLLLWDTTRNTDWQDQLIGGTARVTSANIAAYGGQAQTTFLLRGDYRKETTVFPGAFDYIRAATSFNLEHASQDGRFHFSLVPDYSFEKMVLPVLDLTAQAMALSPVAPSLFDANGRLNWESDTWINPLAYTIQTYESRTSNIILNNTVSYRVVSGLNARATIGYNAITRNETRLEPIRSNSPAQIAQGITGTNISAINTLSTFIAEPQLDYSFKPGASQVNVLIGATYQSSLQQGETIAATGFVNDAVIRDQGSAPSLVQSGSAYLQYKYAAFFGRINYIWGNRYILNVTARRDGSSRFGPGSRYATFGAVGAGWIFTNEAFADGWEGLSFGKVRFSYGTTGSDQIVGDYGYLDSYQPTSLGYDGNGLTAVRPENPNYSWEINRKMEFGLAMAFLKNRIQLEASYYRNRSSQQLTARRLPELTGFATMQDNAPVTVQNSGLELTLGTTHVDGQQVSWTTTANFTMLRNKLVRYDDLAGSTDAGRYIIGSPVDVKMLYHYTGIDPHTGNFTFQDKNGDGLDATDRYPVRYGPRFYGGIDNVIRYRNFELSFLVQFVKQTRQNLLAFFPVPPGGQSQNQPVGVMARWQKDGDNASVHRFTQGRGIGQYRHGILNGDMTYGDASYIRLKSAALSYTIASQAMQNKLRLKTIRVFVMGQNLMTFTGFKGLDPESLDPRVLPPLRMVTAGVEIDL